MKISEFNKMSLNDRNNKAGEMAYEKFDYSKYPEHIEDYSDDVWGDIDDTLTEISNQGYEFDFDDARNIAYFKV